MSGENLSELAAAFEGAAKGAADAVASLCAEDVVWRLSGDHVLSGEYKGTEAVREVVAKLAKFPAGVYSVVPEAATLEGDFEFGFGLVVTRREVARPGVAPIEWRSFDIARFADGRIEEIWTFASPEEDANAGFACPVPAAS
ncbi:MAG TPA: nuclear transport factor 2 family protein [Solirubrobacterales bacterium]|jgi:ketosteroid isomerase-like protein